jgi:tRNA pseudouridine65 synthase
MKLDILYQDQNLVAINKPHGLLVHRSSMAREAEAFALQILRDQLQQYVSPVHRLDRKTAGVLLFALNEEALKESSRLFAENKMEKSYLAIVRGYTDHAGVIDYPLKKNNKRLQEAITHYQTLQRAELDVPFGKHATSRYSLVEVRPQTGRMHQIRKHFSHIFHPIIGDRTHGCNKQNKLFTERWDLNTMLLHAARLEFTHPLNGERIGISAPLHAEFRRMVDMMDFDCLA